ncbi:hypothetical protein [Streptomyces sp. NPDC048639]|uniref:hypothetical protein n=1 Tax=Streptomyces sp. NPDC048639 TaxID=3365581 RepID=UPI00371A840A
MPFLRALTAFPRMLRHGSRVGTDLPPDEAVVLDAPEAPLRAAITAAGAGDFAQVRDLLAGTRLGAEWERRDRYVSTLAEFAVHNPGWLDAWLAASPEDPDAVLVKAGLSIDQAWRVRSAARAAEVSPEQFRAFFALLEDAVPVIRAAADLNPTDPVPWRIALTHARGVQAPREVFDAYWEEAVERAPHHYGCHSTALQYLSKKWYGSHEEMFAFAEHAADAALPGSQLHALPLLAAVEYELAAGSTGKSTGARSFAEDRIAAAIDRALELSSWYDPGDPEVAGVRNHLALMLLRAGRWTVALDVFRAIGVHARSAPWACFGDPRKEFLDFRTGVRMQVAMQTPFFGTPHPPRTSPPDHPEWAPRTLAICAAAPHQVAQAALMCNASLRVAPAGPSATYVELAADPDAPVRGTLLGDEPLIAAVDTLTTGEKWPAIVLHRSGDRSGFTVFQRGRRTAGHHWDPAAAIPSLEDASTTARALSTAFPVADTRPLTALLRSSDEAARRQSDLVRVLGLPAPPTGFGERADVLEGFPGARVIARRGLLTGFRESVTAKPGTMPGENGARPDSARLPTRWWALRSIALLVFLPTTVYAWGSPGVDALRASLATCATLYVGGRLLRAWRRRPRRA